MDHSLIQQQARYKSAYGGPKDRSSPYQRPENMHSDGFKRDQAPYNFSSYNSGDVNLKEEELYNKRRDEEIKRHIQARGSSNDISQKQTNHKSSDLARSRLDQSSLSMISPLQLREGAYIDGQTYETFGSSLPTRDKGSYQQHAMSASGGGIGSSNGMTMMRESGIPSHVKEHIAIVANDNSSLMRRLNLVIQELERVHREKDALIDRSSVIAYENSEMSRHLSIEDNVDKENRYIHDDINYEKERSQNIRQKLKEQESLRADLVRQLRKVEDKQDLCASQNQAQQQELQNKLNHIVDIEKEHYYTQEKMKQVNTYIEKLRLELHHEDKDKLEIRALIESLHLERTDLLNKLDHLTSKYDECVKEITHDRHEMEASNQKHEKLVAAKIIFQELEIVAQTKIRNAFEDMKSYCEFDLKCHRKLKQLASALERAGKYKQKNAITQWYSKALQPIRGKEQGFRLAQKASADKIKQMFFYQWLQRYRSRIHSYDNKTVAVRSMCQIRERDSQIEVFRSFTIWKDVTRRRNLQQVKVQKLLWKKYYQRQSKAMAKWVNCSMQIDTQVRLNLLCNQFSKKKYLSLLFNNFRYQSTERKRERNNIAFHVLKAWQDYIRHRKYLMGAGLSAFHFRKQQNINLVKSCYDSLRYYKEKSKYKNLNQELTFDVLPSIDDLNSEIVERSVENRFKDKAKACRAIEKALGKQVYTYFNQWKQTNKEFNVNLNSLVKNKIIKLYLNHLRRGFSQWHMNCNSKQNTQQSIVVQGLEEEHTSLAEEVSTLQKDVKERNQQLDKSQNVKLHNCVRQYRKRMKQIAVGRWKDNIVRQHVKGDGAELLLKKMRTRFLRQAFDLYKSGSDFKKKLIIEEERCLYLCHTLNERLKRKVYNSWCLYKDNFVRSKNYWNRIYIKMDLLMKQRALKTWKESAQLAVQEELEVKQNEVTSQIEIKNAELGSLFTAEQDLNMQNKVLKASMVKQAQRVLANTFVKYYYIGHTRGFEQWKVYVQQQKQREKLIKKVVDHWRKYQFQNVKARFQKWMANSDLEIAQQKLKREDLSLSNLQYQYNVQNKEKKANNQQLIQDQQGLNQQQQKYNQRLQKTVQLIVNKVDGNYHMSHKRYILQQWRDYVKREKHFIACIQNVINKSLWQRGFSEIRRSARQATRNTQLDLVLNKFRLKFWKRNCSSAFSQWKSGIYNSMVQNIDEIQNETHELVEEHQSKIILRKQENAVKSVKLLKQSVQQNCFNNWKYVTRQLKLNKSKTNNCQNSLEWLNKRNAIQKWNSRTKSTKLQRVKLNKLRTRLSRLKMKAAFEGMKKVFLAAKDFMSRISNLANIHDQQALKIGYNSICSYVKAKNYVYKKKQEHATRDFYSILSNLLARRMRGYLKDLKYKTSLQYKQSLHKMFTVMQKLNNKLRSHFLRWKQLNNYSKLVQELNEEGPVRELWFDEKQLFDNCKRFMQKEGYSQRDIDLALRQGVSHQKHLIMKAVRRMEHYNEDINCKPKMFDRWKRYVHERKLFKYWLQFVDQRSSHIKSDLTRYFDRWKNHERGQKNALNKLSKQDLDSKLIKNCSQLEDLADMIGYKENRIQHLDAQRETLVDNYMKGQKLALALLSNNNKRSLHKAFLRWSKLSDVLKSNTLELTLKKQIESIASLKESLRSLEVDNESLANENEDLRQFSLDGYEIAKNVQVLTIEREKLSVDLADKSQIVRKLLDENEYLTKCLKQAQQEAQQLIRATNGAHQQTIRR